MCPQQAAANPPQRDAAAVEIRAAVGVPLTDLIELKGGNDVNGLQQNADTASDPWGSLHQSLLTDGGAIAAAGTPAATTITAAEAVHNGHQIPALPSLIEGRWAADLFHISDDEMQRPATAHQNSLPIDARTRLPIKNPAGRRDVAVARRSVRHKRSAVAVVRR